MNNFFKMANFHYFQFLHKYLRNVHQHGLFYLFVKYDISTRSYSYTIKKLKIYKLKSWYKLHYRVYVRFMLFELPEAELRIQVVYCTSKLQARTVPSCSTAQRPGPVLRTRSSTYSLRGMCIN